MLKRLQIKGFHSCKDVTLDGLGPITALVGRNGSGKTNILSAINFLARLATGSDLPPVLLRSDRPDFPARSFTADIETGGAVYRYSVATGLEKIEQKSGSRLTFSLKESLAASTGGTAGKES